MTREAALTRKILLALRREGGFWFKVHGSAYQMAGLPDIIGCYYGHFVGLEVKLPETADDASVRQLAVLGSIERAGGCPRVVASTEAALEVIRELRAKHE